MGHRPCKGNGGPPLIPVLVIFAVVGVLMIIRGFFSALPKIEFEPTVLRINWGFIVVPVVLIVIVYWISCKGPPCGRGRCCGKKPCRRNFNVRGSQGQRLVPKPKPKPNRGIIPENSSCVIDDHTMVPFIFASAEQLCIGFPPWDHGHVSLLRLISDVAAIPRSPAGVAAFDYVVTLILVMVDNCPLNSKALSIMDKLHQASPPSPPRLEPNVYWPGCGVLTTELSRESLSRISLSRISSTPHISISWYMSLESTVETAGQEISWVLFVVPILLLLIARWVSTMEYPGDLFGMSPWDRRRRTHHIPSEGSSPWGVAAVIVLLLVLLQYQSIFRDSWLI
ncbi:hypothetical protein FEM48_Zijuj09G0175400 [Ziziphus jujuba var. spinosa]|uniref:Uncharacterized protein n=1 Tax=Ziziphus jujuba var. spinosa TaxID=714518 RepID=A0A978UUC5_ZIZJJ|nr:hypothetical protein FEM48_Zijuj09G0175400 [Ziziphus jujuba var. spinosa]